MMTDAQFRMVLSLSRKAYAAAKADREAEEASYREQGFRSHYCIHGTNQWTDYDNICGGCEDGLSLRRMVINGVHHDVVQFLDRLAWIGKAPGYLPREVSDSLWKWVSETVNREVYQ